MSAVREDAGRRTGWGRFVRHYPEMSGAIGVEHVAMFALMLVVMLRRRDEYGA